MLNLRKQQLEHDSKTAIPFVPNNSKNVKQPVDFEYDVAGFAIDTYKKFENTEVHLHIVWIPHDSQRNFHLQGHSFNPKANIERLYSQYFDKYGNPMAKEPFYDVGRMFIGTIPQKYIPFVKKNIKLYKEVFPQLNYL